MRDLIVALVIFLISFSISATEKSEEFRIIGPSDAVCVGKTITLEASGPSNAGYEYYWYPADKVVSPYLKKTDFIPTETTTLFVVRTAYGNYNDLDTAYITIKVNEQEIEVYGPDFVCLGSSASLEIAPYYSNPIWSTGKKKNQIVVTHPGIYSVKAHDGCTLVKGSQYLDSKTEPLSRIMTNRSTDLCPGDQIELRSFSAVNPSWSNGSNSRSVVVKNAGTYTLQNGNECGIDETDIKINIHSVTADFIPSATELQISENLDLFNHSKSGVRYEWYQNGELFSKEKNASVKFQLEGNYKIELHSFNEYGCKDIMTYPSIVVVNQFEAETESKQDIIFPSAFTPNGDGKNDVFQIYTGDIKNLDVTIYNRWGQVIFEQINTTEVSWNGTDLNGNKLEQGQYVINYSYINKFGEPIANSSTVNILR